MSSCFGLNDTAEVLPSGFHRGNASSPFPHMFTSAGNRTIDTADIQQYYGNIRCEVCSGSKSPLPVHSLFFPKASRSFCVLDSTQHGCREAGKERHFSFLCFTFYPQTCFYCCFHANDTSGGALHSEHLGMGCVNKTLTHDRSFF